MESYISIHSVSREERYKELLPQINSLISGEPDLMANLANASAALKLALGEGASWVGFYLSKGDELVLGPFQGKPACVRIRFGKGVCGTAACERRTIIVPDVAKFPGHIYCDPDSKSEIVVPILRGNKVLGVLDLDSPALNSFGDTDRMYLEEIVSSLAEKFSH